MNRRHAIVTIPRDGLKPEQTLEQLALEALAKRVHAGALALEAARATVPPRLRNRLDREAEWLRLGELPGLSRPFWWWQRAGSKAISQWKHDHATDTGNQHAHDDRPRQRRSRNEDLHHGGAAGADG